LRGCGLGDWSLAVLLGRGIHSHLHLHNHEMMSAKRLVSTPHLPGWSDQRLIPARAGPPGAVLGLTTRPPAGHEGIVDGVCLGPVYGGTTSHDSNTVTTTCSSSHRISNMREDSLLLLAAGRVYALLASSSSRPVPKQHQGEPLFAAAIPSLMRPRASLVGLHCVCAGAVGSACFLLGRRPQSQLPGCATRARLRVTERLGV